MKPLEIKDFSGGQTDNYFQGEPTRAERLYNLLIGIDHKLFSRSGSKVQDNAAKAARINSIESFNSFSDLVYSSEGHFYDIDGNEIVGPIIPPQAAGNAAFVGATDEAMYTSAESQGHLILACDEKLAPQKIYKDEAGNLVTRNVGLPKVTKTAIDDATLLAECITAANLLRTRFLNHINSAQNLDSERDGTSPNYLLTTMQPPTSTNAHWSVDKYAKCYLEAGVTFSPGQWQPSTLPTPAPAATDYNTLVDLIEALNFAFEEHREDSAGFASIDDSSFSSFTFGPNRYHALGYQSQYTDMAYNFGFIQTTGGSIHPYVKPLNQGIQQRITVSYNPDNAVTANTADNEVYRTKLEAIAAFLDDFAVKFCLHETAPFVHRYNFQNAQGNALVDAAFAHQFITPLLAKTPIVIPTPFNFIYASNYVQRAFRNHALNTDWTSDMSATFPTMHTFANETIVSGLQQAGYYFASLPTNPTEREQYSAFMWDVISAKLAIFTARYSYFIHNLDLLGGINYNNGTINGAADAGPIHQASTSTGYDPEVGMAIISAYNTSVAPASVKDKSFNGIISKRYAPGWFNVSRSAVGYSAVTTRVGTFMMHPYPIMTANSSYPNYSQTNGYLQSFGYAPDIYDLAGWVDVIKSFYDAFKAHLADTGAHFHTALASTEFMPTDASTGLPAGGTQYFPLSSLLPSVNLTNTAPKFFIPDIVSYGYAFTYSDTYTLENGVTFKVESAPTFTDAVNSEETLAVGVTKLMYGETNLYITNEIITPVAMVLGAAQLTNDSETNYAATLLNSYRTTGNGTSYFKVATLAATPLYIPVIPKTINLLGMYDLVADAYSINGSVALNDSQDILYTNGGISPSNQPPKCKYTWIANDYVYYGGVYDGDTFLPNRVIQAVQLAPDWAPSQNFVGFPSPVVGGGSARNVNVCMTETGVYRLEGAFGKDGSGAITKQQISNQIGGISGSSIVVTEVGLFFAATNGFYYTDGYQCIRLSQELFRTYENATKTAAQKRSIKGVYDRANRRIFWSVRSTTAESDNNVLLAYDLNFGITPSGAFTTLFGGAGSWNPSAIGFLGDTLYIGDTDGYLYYWDENTKTDPLKDLALAPSNWGTTHVPWEYRSSMMDFGGTAMRKFFSRIHHVGKNRGDVALQYYITADNRVTQDLAPMRFIDDNSTGIVDQWRRVGGKKLRADLYQVGVKNGRFTVYNSDTFAGTPVFVSHIGNDTTIDMLDTHIPADAVGMGLCFATDYYVTEFIIKSVTIAGLDTTLVLEDPLNKANNLLALGWEIRGFMKEQAFSLDALTIWFEEQGNLGSQYRGYSSEEGGGGNK